jgi:hypothetical protein
MLFNIETGTGLEGQGPSLPCTGLRKYSIYKGDINQNFASPAA